MSTPWLPFQLEGNVAGLGTSFLEALRSSPAKGIVQSHGHVLFYGQGLIAKCLEVGEQEVQQLSAWVENVKAGSEPPDPAKSVNLQHLDQGGAAALVKVCSAGLDVLQHLAALGHPLALMGLAGIFSGAVRDFNADLARKPEWLQALAGKFSAWPVCFSPHPEQRTNTDQLEKVVGIDSPLAAMGKGQKRKKPVSFETPQNKLARQLYLTLAENRRRWHPKVNRKNLLAHGQLPEWVRECKDLPDFNSATVPDWLDVGWKAVLEATNGRPESSRELCALVTRSKQNRYNAGTKSRTSFIRAEVRQSLKRALTMLAPRQRKSPTPR